MKTTFQAVIEFANTANAWLAQDPKNDATKLGWAIKRMLPRVKKANEEFANDCEDIRTNNAATDKDGILLKEDNSTEYRYTLEGATKRNKEIRERLRQEIEIEPYFATDLPVDDKGKSTLTYAEQLAFSGFIIKEEAVAAAE